MVLQLWRNKSKLKEGEPDYLALQKQRTCVDDGSSGYETVKIGVGYKEEAPDGEQYIRIKIDGITDVKPK